MNRILIFLFLLGTTLLPSVARSQTISGAITGGVAARGSTARGVITMNIPGGLHVNSNRPSSQYAIATTVRISGPGLRAATINYPRGKNRKFEFSESPINVYEGTVRFPFSVKIPANFRGNAVHLRAVVHYQACTNEVCYPPKDKDITITARIR